MRNRAGIAVAAAGSLLLALTGCSLLPQDDGGALEQAEHYLELVATGGQQDLHELAAMTANDQPDVMRIAGDMLVGAVERIEVVDVGEPRAVTTIGPDITIFDVSGTFTRVVQVEVTYRLDGKESTGTVLLGLLEDEPARTASSWVVVGPLVGTIGLVRPAFTTAIVPDVYISGIRAVLEGEQPLYPAVYEIERTADPYLTSEPASIPVVAGTTASLPTATLVGTDATVAELVTSLEARFDECTAPRLDCPLLSTPQDADTLGRHGIENAYDGGWWLGLTAPPALTLGGQGTFEATGSYTLQLDNRELEVPYLLTGTWNFDGATMRPAVFLTELVER